MTRFLIIGIAVALALTVFAGVDAILLDKYRVRGVPKGLWIVIIILLPVVGPVLWFLVGRGKKSEVKYRRGKPIAPDDDIDFLRGLNIPKPDNDPDSQKPDSRA